MIETGSPPPENWPLLVDPRPDLPAALAGSARPEQIFGAVEDLEDVLASFTRWSNDVAFALFAATGEAPPDWNRRIWSTGSHRSVLKDSSLLADLDALAQRLDAASHALLSALGSGDRPTPADYRRLLDLIEQFAAGLRKAFADAWNRLANIDPMTGLGNRAAMLRRLAIECDRHQRSRQPCCVAVIDLDDFKPINDSYGHPTGDRVLRSVASLLATGVRPYDDVFRYGGDEFVLCLPNTDLRTAWGIVERLRLKVAGWAIPATQDLELSLTVSIGVAPLTAELGVDATLELADRALYAAKRSGRNGIHVLCE